VSMQAVIARYWYRRRLKLVRRDIRNMQDVWWRVLGRDPWYSPKFHRLVLKEARIKEYLKALS